MDKSELEKRIIDDALIYANKHKKIIAKRLTDKNIYFPEKEPVSVFMAGSPGAGKTEASKALLENKKIRDRKILRIDPDELRNEFPAYIGDNKILPEHFIEQYFQARVNVNRLKRKFDGTIQVDLLQKHYDGTNRFYKANIDQIDNHVPEKYSHELLERIIRLDYD